MKLTRLEMIREIIRVFMPYHNTYSKALLAAELYYRRKNEIHNVAQVLELTPRDLHKYIKRKKARKRMNYFLPHLLI